MSYVLPLRRQGIDASNLNLSVKEKEAVQASWAIARKDYDAAGLGFFNQFILQVFRSSS